MIRVHIERLILDGVAVSPEERPGLQASVARELGILLANGGIAEGLQTGGAIPSLRGAPMPSGEGKLAGKIAGGVYGGIGK